MSRSFVVDRNICNFCGMVGVRAKVLGQMGWTTSPYQRAGALSCPSLAIYGPGPTGSRPLSCSPPSRCPKPSRARCRLKKLKFPLRSASCARGHKSPTSGTWPYRTDRKPPEMAMRQLRCLWAQHIVATRRKRGAPPAVPARIPRPPRPGRPGPREGRRLGGSALQPPWVRARGGGASCLGGLRRGRRAFLKPCP